MSGSARDIDAAQQRAAVARDRLAGTVATLQSRLRPATLARTATRAIADTTSGAARDGIEIARRNPAALVGVATLAGLFLARNRIRALWRRKA